ncbi:MAG: carbohydrate kinase family protein [Clostridia bacterium]|nr:carbohydrate kinase family protein [Clostridia bacterium]
MTRPIIACFGGANMDLHIQSSVPVVLRDSNPGKIHTSPGGVMRNIAENCARLGCAPVLLSSVGNDAFGDRIRKASEEAGIDMRYVLVREDCPTSCYMAFMDETGDMLVAANDMRIMDLLPADYLPANGRLLQEAKAIVCDANPPAGLIAQLAAIAYGVPIFADPVSVAKGAKFLPVLERIFLLKPNQIELQHLSGMPCSDDPQIEAAANSLLKKGLQSIAVSLGSRGCYYADREGRSFFRRLAPVSDMANATGAGDAFTAGLVSAYAKGAGPEDMVDYALACGIAAVQSEDTINAEMSDALVQRILNEHRL